MRTVVELTVKYEEYEVRTIIIWRSGFNAVDYRFYVILAVLQVIDEVDANFM